MTESLRELRLEDRKYIAEIRQWKQYGIELSPLEEMALRLADLLATRTEARTDSGCKCVCHQYPEHGKLQDALEALKWHQEQVATRTEASPAPEGEVYCYAGNRYCQYCESDQWSRRYLSKDSPDTYPDGWWKHRKGKLEMPCNLEASPAPDALAHSAYRNNPLHVAPAPAGKRGRTGTNLR